MREDLDTIELTDLSLQSPILMELEGHWKAAKADREMPARADISPFVLGPKLMPHIMIAEIENQERLRVLWRLIGTHITQTVGRDVTGTYWDEIYNPEVLASMLLRVQWIQKHRRPLHTCGISPDIKSNTGTSKSVYLPLSNDGTTINMILIGSEYTLKPKR